MIVRKNFSILGVFIFTGHHFIWLIPLILGVGALQQFTGWDWTKLPFQPIAIVGTAVAFYLGFKNNQSYDRLWEARKIWGAVVNSSRAWGSTTKAFVSNLHTQKPVDETEIAAIKKKIIYRHIAWLYALRSQLLIPTSWEHIKQRGLVGIFAKRRQRRIGVGLWEDEITEDELLKYLPENEHERLVNYQNTATQIIDQQVFRCTRTTHKRAN
jgi:putative membrane protein